VGGGNGMSRGSERCVDTKSQRSFGLVLGAQLQVLVGWGTKLAGD